MSPNNTVSPETRFISFALGIIVMVLFIWVLVIGRSIILPIMIALFLSYILDPIVNLLQRWKIPNSLAVFITIILAFVVLYLLGLIIYANVEVFVDQFPKYKVRLLEMLNNLTQAVGSLLGRTIDINAVKKIDWVATLQKFSVGQGIVTGIGTFLTFFMKMILVVLFMAYFLTGKRNLDKKIHKAFPGPQAERIAGVIGTINSQVQSYLSVKTLISFVTGLVSIGVFYAFGLDFAIFWGFVIFLFNYIPNIGSFIASVLPVLFSLLQFGSIAVAFWIMVAMAAIQFLMGNVIEPRLMGRTLNLSPLIVILSLIFWGYIWGVAGMILAVPILAMSAIVFENIESLRFLSVFIRGKVEE
ncbi:MAG TPA: AI-2E family transporter [Caldithrix abyssi]|uniref:AI-2E family transporter n=1 Tax=Caldithrix abyssi TaxID=187145 RepID=A0A7V4TZB6_CALAY|nr:AI-2E family transporter [Caldithrix abyssi]